MSGTSVDAIDCALVRCHDNKIELLATHDHAIPSDIKHRISELCHSGSDEIERVCVLDRELGLLFAEATRQLLVATKIRAEQITAIGSHGQTIRHRPPSAVSAEANSFTLQIGDPNTIAEKTGITTIADFRRRDVAAGGEGAPLAPAFHAAAFAKAGVNRAIVNIGGIANATFLEGTELHSGFDTGPGNTLLDQWAKKIRGESYDKDGRWSTTGRVNQAVLEDLLAHDYFRKTGPRSTGREEFNLSWLESRLTTLEGIAPSDLQATLLELTSTTIATAIQGSPLDISEVYICGGGCHNAHLMQRLTHQLAPAEITTTLAIGMDPDWVEAVTFAWLASRTLENLAGNCPTVTGARGPRVLGGIYLSGL